MTSAELETRGWHISFERMVWLSLGLLLVLAPHAPRLPAWISVLFLVLAGWRLYTVRTGRPLPHRYIMGSVVLAAFAGVYLSYGTLTGRDAGVAMLAVLAGMKIAESRVLRDAYVVVFLGFFLVVTNFLYSESIPTGLYMLVVVAVLIGSLVAISTEPSALVPQRQLRLAAVILVQAVPVMLVAFLLFPRISGPLWGLPKDAFSARSGLSNSMRPGDISGLSLSDEVAFRVRFDAEMPDHRELYWRGPVLWKTDGRTWTAGESFRRSEPIDFVRRGSPVDYVITIEPHQRRWLFALELPATIPRMATMSANFELRSVKRVQKRMRYRVRSYTDYQLPRVARAELTAGLELAAGAHPKARELALKWRRELARPRAIVEHALGYFRDQPFVYTLTPPLLTRDNVDEFLFETRQGFCEHFASAFTVLMRAAGVPSRVVTGYQGGELNELGNFLTVRQRDAHAWSEVWLGELEGWVRVDPTGAAAPARIESGMEAAIPRPIGPSALNLQPSAPVRRAWRSLRHGLEALNNAWNEWVLGYGPERQRRLLNRFGIDATDFTRLAVWLIFCVLALLAGTSLLLARRPRTRDPAIRAYRKFQNKLARAGLERAQGEGPLDFAERVIRTRPDLALQVTHITDMYVSIRYAREGGDPRILNRAVAAFGIQ
jgi:transglutaminase-like putative cysteine protease